MSRHEHYASLADVLALARIQVIKLAPYFTTAVTALVPVEARWCQTMGVTKTGVLLYNPDWVNTLSVEELAAVYWHEVMHVILDSHGRREDRNPRLWNIAHDIYINDQGRSSLSLKFPEGGWFPEKIGAASNLTGEEYYSLLAQMAEEALQQILEQISWSGECGSGAGNPLEGEESVEVTAHGRSESSINQVRMAVAEAVLRDAANGGGRGNMPCGLDRWAADMIKPAKVPWQAVLARKIRQALGYRPGGVRHSFARVSRRQGAAGLGPLAPRIPASVQPRSRAAVVLDTSGSMSQEQLARGIAETTGVLRACGSEITFLSCDYDVHAHGMVSNPQQLARLVKGGGGSSFVPAFDLLHKRAPADRPSVVIFMTDGDICVPPTSPSFDVIWLLIDAARAPTEAYGEVVKVDG